MAPQTTERPLTAQEAMIADQRKSLAAAAEGKPFEPAEVEYGPDAVLGFDTENVGDPSVHNVINSPYLKGMMERGTAVGGPLEAAQLHGFTEKGRAVNVVDHAGAKTPAEHGRAHPAHDAERAARAEAERAEAERVAAEKAAEAQAEADRVAAEEAARAEAEAEAKRTKK